MTKVSKLIDPTESAADRWMSMDEFEDVSPASTKVSLRPDSFDSYIGQESVKSAISVACIASRERLEALDHVLLYGPPGLGKTSIAKLISNELGVGFKLTSGPVIEKSGDLAAILTSLHDRDVLFIDEIHRLPKVVEEVLYSAMEDFALDVIIGQGPAAKSIRIELKPFTLIGATTRAGLLSSPLRDRFGIVQRLEYYSSSELKLIVEQSARLLNCTIESEAAFEIGCRSRGTPRIANRLLKRVRDYAQVDSVNNNNSKSVLINIEHVKSCLDALRIDPLGLDAMDLMLLETVINKYGGGPVGLDTIAASIGEEAGTIEDVYEPFLLQQGLLARTRRGRQATFLAYQHLSIDISESMIIQNQGILNESDKGA